MTQQRPNFDDVSLSPRATMPPPVARLATHPNAPTAKRGGFGTIPAATAGVMARAILMIGAWSLVALSVAGTAFAWRSVDAPLTDPIALVTLFVADARVAGMALLAQGILSIVQWGSRANAKYEPRWWVLYALSLALSVYWNWDAYGVSLIALGAPWALALALVTLGDILAEVGIAR